jgi:hypothetical protein
MELYVLDSLLRRSVVIDAFDSCVWTERYNDVGDLTLDIHSTLGNRNLLTAGTLLAMNRSKRVMKIDTVENKSNSDGTKVLTLTGSSVEAVLDERTARDTMASGTTLNPTWVIQGVPAAIAREIFQKVMVDAVLDPADAMPYYAVGNLYPEDTIPEPEDEVEVSIGISTVLQALRSVCQTYDLGFRITRNGDSGQLFFNVYSGNDRTSGQTEFPPVVFAPALDNLQNTSYLTSNKQYKSVAYVFCPDGTAKVYAVGVDPEASGFSRRVLSVNATDIKYPARADIDPAPYTVTEEEATAVAIVKGLPSTTELQGNSLQKIPNMHRILPQDEVNILAAMSDVFALTGTQASSITSAQSKAGVTQDQKNALISLGALTRLTSADVSSLNMLLSNNTALTSTEKTDITDAANNQAVMVTPGEVSLIEAAIATSHTYDDEESDILQALLTARGVQELAKNNNITAFDGEIPEFSTYRYDVDYYLGDIIEVRNEDGVVNNVRVTEQIFSQDASGEKSYPTLSSRLVITPGVWAAWDSNQDWADVPDTEHWEDLP